MRKIVNIYVDEDEGTVSASIAGLSFDAANMVIERATAEAQKLLEIRARRRRFRRPVIFRSFDSSGKLIMKHDASGWTWGGADRGEPGAIAFEDARGRKASIRIEIERADKNPVPAKSATD